MVNEDLGINIEELAQTIADDINKLGKLSEPKDLKSIDFAAFRPMSTLETLKGPLNQVKAKAEEASRQHKKMVQEISGGIENTIKDRQIKLAAGLEQLGKTAIKEDAESKTILKRVSDRVDLGNRCLNELTVERTIKTVPLKRTGITNVNIEK